MRKFSPVSPKLRQFLRPACLFFLTFALSSARLGGAYAPWALALVCLAGPKLSGFSALLGAAAGAFAFFDFQPGLRFLASAILIFSVSTAFYDCPIYGRPAFRPAGAAAVTALVQSVWLIERPLSLTVTFALSLALQWAVFAVLSPLQNKHPTQAQRRRAAAFLLPAVCVALMPLESHGFSAGRALLSAVILLLTPALASPAAACAAGLTAGLTADLSSVSFSLCTAAYACAAAAAWFVRDKRWLAAPLFALTASAMALFFQIDAPIAFLYETLLGAAVYLLLPRHLLPAAYRSPKAEALPPSPLQSQLARSAAAFRELHDSFFRGTVPAPPENPSVIFDRTAEQVCRKCVLCSTCWHQNYNATYNAFNDACPVLLRRGQAAAKDFPIYFTSRCVHLQEFVAALNGELQLYLLRRQYYKRLLDERRLAQEQYAQLGELLAGTAAVEVISSAPIGYRIASDLHPKEGNNVCGDQLAVFEAGGTLYLLLCDGMGSGESAHREAAMTVRLLQQFLQAGIDPVPALKTLNMAWRLRGEDGGGFTTIDLLALQRQSGSATLYKYGAAPSYLKRSGTVSRFTASALPAGLHDTGSEPGCCKFSLPGGSFFVMVSDGIADQADDEWLQNLLAGWNGSSADALAGEILAQRRSRHSLDDDCALLILHLAPPGEGEKRAV